MDKKLTILSKFDLQKSNIDLYELNRTIPIEKTGSEIKAKLIEIRGKFEAKCEILQAKLVALKEATGCEPDYSRMSGDGETYLPTYTRKLQESPSIEGEVQDDKSDLKSNYNDCVYQYEHCMKDLRAVETLINNLAENKKYTLSLSILTQLGF